MKQLSHRLLDIKHKYIFEVGSGSEVEPGAIGLAEALASQRDEMTTELDNLGNDTDLVMAVALAVDNGDGLSGAQAQLLNVVTQFQDTLNSRGIDLNTQTRLQVMSLSTNFFAENTNDLGGDDLDPLLLSGLSNQLSTIAEAAVSVAETSKRMVEVNEPLGAGGRAPDLLAAEAAADDMIAMNEPLGDGGFVEAQQDAAKAASAEQYNELGANAAERFAAIDFRGFNLWNNSSETGLITKMNKEMGDKLRNEIPAALVGSSLAENYAANVLASAETELEKYEQTTAVGHFDGVDVTDDGDALIASITGAQSFDEFTLLSMANDELPPSEMLAAVDHLSGEALTDANAIIANRIARAEAGTDLDFTRQWAHALEATGHPSAVAVAAVDTQLTSDSLSTEYAAARAEDRAGIDDARAQFAAREAEAAVGLEAFGGPGTEEGIGDVVLTSAEATTLEDLNLSLSGKHLDLTAALSVDPDMVTSGLNVRQEGQTDPAFTLRPGTSLTFNGGDVQTGRELGFAPNVHEIQFISVTDDRGRTGFVAADYLIN